MKKQRNVHGGETRKGAFPGKKYAALALCVSLWMAGGSVASAKDLYLDENNQPKYVSGSKPEGATVESSGTTLTVTGGNWNSWYIFGCKNDSAPLSNYILNINNITNVNYVYGAYAETKAERNEVTLNGRNIQANNVYGGYVKGSGVATCNKVNLENGATVKGDVYGGCPESEGSATYNEVTLDDATANANVYGGRTTGDGTSTGNVVTLKNGATVKVDVYGGRTGYGTATYNKVMLKNGATVEKNVYGGYAGGNGNTQNNEVTLDSSTVEGNVYGGYVQGGGNNKKATDNTVTLNSATVTGNVYGGLSNSASGGDSVTGNTLNLSGANTAKSIANFDTVNIVSAKWGTPALIQGGDIGTVNSISTEGIAFSGTNAIAAGGTTPLIQGGMGGYDQTKVTGSTYTLGTTLQGEGHAVVDENNLM
ncbi:MAG: hypothetical protein IKW79_05390, partial [Schwartzia sp.]|nr:hypothetical protein [Schwartzia sp. (in: firmicutes)]